MRGCACPGHCCGPPPRLAAAGRALRQSKAATEPNPSYPRAPRRICAPVPELGAANQVGRYNTWKLANMDRWWGKLSTDTGGRLTTNVRRGHDSRNGEVAGTCWGSPSTRCRQRTGSRTKMDSAYPLGLLPSENRALGRRCGETVNKGSVRQRSANRIDLDTPTETNTAMYYVFSPRWFAALLSSTRTFQTPMQRWSRGIALGGSVYFTLEMELRRS